MKIFVTGATGLLGRAVCWAAQRAGYAVYPVRRSDFDLTCAEDVAQVGWADADVVVHCAARIDGVKHQKADPSAAVTDNLVMSARVIDAVAKSRKGARLIFVSSSTVYPCRLGADDVAVEDWPIAPEPQYRGVAGVKAYLESLCGFYAAEYGLRYVVLRPTAIYGPGDRSHHVVPDLVRRACDGEVPLEVWGRPDTVRDFVFVDDVAAAVLASLAAPGGDVYNVGSGTRRTIEQLANEVLIAVWGMEKLVAMEDRMSSGPVRFVDGPLAIPTRQVSIEKAERDLGWKPTVDLREGLRRTVKWHRLQGNPR